MRRGELTGLRWCNVNLTTGTPNSKASRRTLPLPDEVVAVLKAARKAQAQEQLQFGPGYGDADYVARDATGMPYYPGVLTDRWRDLLKDMKIDHVRLHDARHTCGTLMHLQGVPIAVIAARQRSPWRSTRTPRTTH